MFDGLADVELKLQRIDDELSQPGLNGRDLTRLSKERAEIVEVVDLYRAYKDCERAIADARVLLNDSEMRDLAKEELATLESRLEQLTKELKIHLLPKDINDGKNVFLEIRAGTGGDEAALFCGDLMRMYMRYAERRGWSTEVLSSTEGEKGGFKEVIVLVGGADAFRHLKFESGVHRVQRVPATESQGRIHTSACTVAVLPEAEDVDIEINPADLEIKACRAQGAGGQHINTTDSAIRIVHLPTGVVAECQEERSQHKNKEKAMRVLKSRLLERLQSEQQAQISADRKAQVGSGDRSERIRTYNFPQGRMTDHRINLTLYKLEQIIEGDIGEMVDALVTDHQTQLLSQLNAGAFG